MTTAAAQFSPAVQSRLNRLMYVGSLTEANAQARGGRLIATAHGAEGAADHLKLHLVVDPTNTVRDARFTSNAQGELLAAYDAMCELAIGKPLVEAATISPKVVEAHLRLGGEAGSGVPAFPLTLDADQPFYVLRKAAERLHPPGAQAPAQAAKPFDDCGLFEKVRRIEQVLDDHVRPALASDGGGLDLVDLQGRELAVQYHGACGSCSSSIGGTLQFIQDSLNNHLATTLVVKVSGMDEEAPFAL